jgi:stearoyl-CoA desaturase (delta-9 desaturase)
MHRSRGFFFSHIGWLMCKKHPDVKKYGRKVDMSDLERDPIVMFQHKYYLILMPICCFIIPMAIPTLWGVSLYDASYMNIMRYMAV